MPIYLNCLHFSEALSKHISPCSQDFPHIETRVSIFFSKETSRPKCNNALKLHSKICGLVQAWRILNCVVMCFSSIYTGVRCSQQFMTWHSVIKLNPRTYFTVALKQERETDLPINKTNILYIF